MRKRNVRKCVRLRGNESGRIINYCIEKLKRDYVLSEILNSINKFYLLLIKIKAVLWQNPGVTNCIHSNTRDTEPNKTERLHL
jgi:hypothetical protein